ncbi:MAG: hypothetical protein CMG74_00980 [Candidatus Marinimicrobia bacterium]|nr:hypothetical protein [Candidatus Neomarinimicrobiota bacterium]|tara:strand:+ start:25039 stop:25566 length:528 start_codon:yes stop_codon:yes gene_type:complete
MVHSAKVKMVISDVDGVWTDGSIYIGSENNEFKKFSVLDGVGVAMARAAKLHIALLSGRYSSATEHRAEELNIFDVCNGGLNKLHFYNKLKSKYSLSDDEIAYIGDDLIDLPVMEQVGVPIAVQNAHPEVKSLAVHTTQSIGGNGAFREAIEWVIDQKGLTTEVYKIMREKISAI